MLATVDIDQLLDALAEKLSARLADRLGGNTGTVTPRLLTVDQTATYIGQTRDAVQHMVATGKVPTVRSDRRVFIDIHDLDKWIGEHKQAGM